MSRQLTLMEAQAAGHIAHIRGHDSNIGMTIEVQNDSDEAITITSEPGTVIGSKDPHTQKMVITRGSSFTVSPRSRESITVDALCLEAHKAPPSSQAGETDHNIDGMTDNTDIRKVLGTLHKVETEISANITEWNEEDGTFTHTLDDPNLITLASASTHTKVEGQHAFQSRIIDPVVQMPVWQITDRLGITDYAKVVGMNPATHEELRRSVEVLSSMAKVAEILLAEAELSNKQTIRPAEDELEVLHVEHDLLSSNISRLRREALAPGVDKESVRIQLSQETELLNEKEREIGVYPHKNTLIKELLRLPITSNLAGRTTLLYGMPAGSLQRDESIPQHDLDLIITQLARLGRDEHGNVLLIELINNALPYAEGFETHSTLISLKSEFALL
jgi:hypothetical protein